MTGRMLFALALFAAAPLHAQERPQQRPITGEGTEGFRALLRVKGLTPLESVTEVNGKNAKDVLVIAFRGADETGQLRGDSLERLRKDGLNLRAFFEGGGSLLIATDQKTDNKLKTEFDAQVTGTMLEAATELRKPYLGRMECPYVARFEEKNPDLFTYNGEQLSHVATNRPSYLDGASNLDTIAIFPIATAQKIGQSDSRWRQFIFAQSGFDNGSGGRVMILADHSIFINSMMLPQRQDNDNLRFASRCLDVLIEHPDGKRKFVLFIEDGNIDKKADYRLDLISVPGMPEDLADFLWKNRDLIRDNPAAVEALAGELEDSGLIGEMETLFPYEDLLNDAIGPRRLVRGLFILGAIGLLVYSAVAFMRSRYAGPKRSPRLAMALERMRPRAGLIEQRVRGGVGRGLYYELARQRARDKFAKLGIKPIDGTPIPKFTVAASWLQRGRIARELRNAWAVAFDPEPAPVAGREWEQWLRRLNNLGAMIEHGAIRFEA